MSTVVIHGEGLGKSYHRGALQQSTLLRDHLSRMLKSPLSVFRRPKKDETFWALEDVSLEVREGEVLGLIGRNGAGKTTLLKILSRITKPTTGWAEIHGSVGSLLEVGTGFHPELTGRENTFLSGAILGMGKSEIKRKFDEIVAFAELERFIDTPVKHYSSGMHVRLAFAVAAHLEPEILLVDEVLAVGDINFQKKCLGKMGDVAHAGRTIVFVSHQMAQIRRLCQRALWIEGGGIRMNASSHEVVGAYESAMARGSRNKNEPVRGSISRFLSWEIGGRNGDNRHSLNNLEPVTIRIALEVQRPIAKAMHGIALYNHEQQLIWSKAPQKLALESGEYALDHTFPMLPLRPGLYTWAVTLYDDGKLVDGWNCEPEMNVVTESYQTPFDEWTGILNIPSNFEAKIETASLADGSSVSQPLGK
ncbi:MAG: polysaccharide ABC transporter ATP-binding protein [Terriglobales bacterium]|jgi:lipopolysaccharide transport system ATP-binding protein